MVSVIVPNFNHAPYLKRRLDSVINQSFHDFEVIILDDCSSDNSREIIEQYRDHLNVAQIIYNERNSGSVFNQWKKGVDLASGDYVWIAESDDYADSKFLENLVPILQSDLKLGFVYCNSKVVLQNGIIMNRTLADIRNELYSNFKWSFNYVNDGKDEIKENLLQGCTVNNTSAVLFRRSALTEVNPFDKTFKYVGDWYCYLKLCKDFKMAYINNALNYYREHQVNASKGLYKNLDFLQEYFILFDWIYRNVNFIDKKIIRNHFNSYTRHSLIKYWNKDRFTLYRKLYKVNPELFLYLIKNNVISSFKERVN